MTTGENGSFPVADWDKIAGLTEGEDDPGEIVDVPAWGVSFRVRGLSHGEVQHILDDDTTPDDAEVFLLSRTILEPACDEERARLLRRKNPQAVKLITDAVYRRSGMGARFPAGNPG